MAQQYIDLENYFIKLINQHRGLSTAEIREAFDKAVEKRDPRIDLSLHFNVLPEKIATTPDQITPETEIWCGEIFKYSFKNSKDGRLLREYVRLLPLLVSMGIRIFFSSISPNEVEIAEVEANGKDAKQLLRGINKNGGNYSELAKKMATHKNFQTTLKGKILRFVIIEVGRLNMEKDTTQNIWRVSEEMGLKDCPHDLALLLGSSKKHYEWIMGKFLRFKTNPIADSKGNPHIFSLGRGSYGLSLFTNSASPDNEWPSDYKFAFLLPDEDENEK